MNRTKIEWVRGDDGSPGYTWNPVTGCLHNCSYCYARRMALRFQGDFEPRFHPGRLDQPLGVKKSSRIFVCSVADLFGDWVPREWIIEVGATVMAYPWHTYIFLTKNPKRYAEFNPWPDNCWLGTTITNQSDADAKVSELFKTKARVWFVSAEPLLGAIDLSPWLKSGLEVWAEGHPESPQPNWPGGCSRKMPGLSWLIIGGMTGPGAVEPEREWIINLKDQARAAKVPVFLKDNLKPLVKIQEFPR